MAGFLDLKNAKRIWHGGEEVSQLWAGGAMWIKPAAPAASIEDYYGTGVGQIEVHFSPSTAVINAQGNVSYITNAAGGSLRANRTGAGQFTVGSDGYFSIPGNVYTLLSSTLDMMNKRLFMSLSISPSSAGDIKFMGATINTGDGGRTNFQWTRSTDILSILRWHGSGWSGINFTGGAGGADSIIADSPELLEVEMLPQGTCRTWINGVSCGTTQTTWTNYLINKVFAGHSNPGLTGKAGDIVFMHADGSAQSDLAAENVRNILMNNMA